MKPLIVFDFGGVLLDWDPRYLYRKLFDGDERGMDRFLAEVEFYDWNQQQDAGRSFAEGIESGCEKYPQYCDLLRAYDERWAESIAGPIWDTVSILERLKLSGYRLFGLSNWSAEKFYLVRHQYEFLGWFEQIILSGDVGLAKPDPRIFDMLLEQAGETAENCLLIDDSIQNIQAACALGFQVVAYKNPEQLGLELMKLGLLFSG